MNVKKFRVDKNLCHCLNSQLKNIFADLTCRLCTEEYSLLFNLIFFTNMPSPQKFAQASGDQVATKNISNLSVDIFNKFESKVVAPRNPKLIRATELPKSRVSCVQYTV